MHLKQAQPQIKTRKSKKMIFLRTLNSVSSKFNLMEDQRRMNSSLKKTNLTMKFISLMSFVLLMTMAFSASAQKFGHINSADLLALMPEIKKADSVLQTYQKSLEEANTSML